MPRVTTTEEPAECVCWRRIDPGRPGVVETILHPACPFHGIEVDPDAWRSTVHAPQAIVLVPSAVSPEELQTVIDLATEYWPDWEALFLVADDPKVWALEPTKVIAGEAVADYLREQQVGHDRALLKILVGDLDLAIGVLGPLHERAGTPYLQVDYSGVDLTSDQADRLVELGARDER